MSSVANLTRQDGYEFIELIQQVTLQVSVSEYALEDANKALNDLRQGSLNGSAVLRII